MTYQRQPLSVTGIITNQAEGEPVITNYRRAVGEVVIGNVSDRCEWVFNIFLSQYQRDRYVDFYRDGNNQHTGHFSCYE